jgi:uncharacterized delta-60 repeat protein
MMKQLTINNSKINFNTSLLSGLNKRVGKYLGRLLLFCGLLCVFPVQALATVVVETGSVDLTGTIDDGEVVTVSYRNSFDNPVVIAFVKTANDAQPIYARIQNITEQNFQVFMQQPDYGSHATETIAYMVVESGYHEFDDGLILEAGKVPVTFDNSGYGTYTYQQAFSAMPSVLHTVASNNNQAFKTSHHRVQRPAALSTLSLRLDSKTSASAASVETVAWVASNSGFETNWDIFDADTDLSSASPARFYIQSPNNPLSDISINGYYLSLADLDGDSDLDVIQADPSGSRFYKNTGSAAVPVYVEQTGAQNLAATLFFDSHSRSTAVAFGDLDGDGDLDAATGGMFSYSNQAAILENVGTVSIPDFVSTGLSFGEAGNHAGYLALGDLNGDNKLDMVFTDSFNNTTSLYLNTRNGIEFSFSQQLDGANPFDEMTAFRNVPILIDYDNDGDLDFFQSGEEEQGYRVQYYENVGNATNPEFTKREGSANPFNSITTDVLRSFSVGENNGPNGTDELYANTAYDAVRLEHSEFSVSDESFLVREKTQTVVGSLHVDVANPLVLPFTYQITEDASGLFEINSDGEISTLGDAPLNFDAAPSSFNSGREYKGYPLKVNVSDKNGVTASADVFVEVTALQFGISINSDLLGIGRASADTVLSGLTKPSFVDLDGDGDQDVVVGKVHSETLYFKNVGNNIDPEYQQVTGYENPLSNNWGIFDNSKSSHAFYDIDNDGDQDLLLDDLFYENTGRPQTPYFTQRTGAENPLNGIALGSSPAPVWGDINNDGVMDLVLASQTDGSLVYVENSGTVSSPVFTLVTGADSPFDGMNVGAVSYPALIDFDGDKDLDLVVGRDSETIELYVNTGSPEAAQFSLYSGNAKMFSPKAARLDSIAPAFSDINGDGHLEILVGEVNDMISYFENYGLAQYRFTENNINQLQIGSLASQVAQVTSDVVGYSFSSGNDEGLFVIDNSGVIKISDGVVFDYETMARYYPLEVTVTYDIDQTDVIAVYINLENEVENPVLADVSYDLTENVDNAFNVGAIDLASAILDDTNANSNIAFAILSGNDLGIFSIDSATGEITISNGMYLDYEQTQSYSLLIGISDANGSSSRYVVTINMDNDSSAADLLSGSVTGTSSIHQVAQFSNTATDSGISWNLGSAGDFNGDGLADLIIGSPNDDTMGNNVGLVYLVWGRADGVMPSLDDVAMGNGGILIQGEAAGGRAGFAVAGGDDINGDGYDDIVIGAPEASDINGVDITFAGKSYVVFGFSHDAMQNSAAIDLADIVVRSENAGFDPGDILAGKRNSGFVIKGAVTYDYSGGSLSLGDVNGDGLADIVIGEPLLHTNQYIAIHPSAPDYDSTYAHVVFGKTAVDAVDLAEISTDDNDQGFVIGTSGDRVVYAMHASSRSAVALGDTNADGLEDILVTTSFSSQSYVVFGKADGESVDVTGFDESGRGFIFNSGENEKSSYIFGPDPALSEEEQETAPHFNQFYMGLGLSVSEVGDVNGDGLNDFAVMAPDERRYLDWDYSKAFVVFGRDKGDADYAQTLNSVSIGEGVGGFSIINDASDFVPELTDVVFGFVSGAGDVNGDGYDDIIFGEPDGKNTRGTVYVVYGKPTTEAVLLSNVVYGSGGYQLTGAINDQLGMEMAPAADVNGDGIDDFLLGAPEASDISGSRITGRTYLLYGQGDAIDQWGSEYSDVLIGTDAADHIASGLNDDTLYGMGGADVLFAGPGDDRLIVTDTDFLRINGGTGFDVLELSGSLQKLDLAAMPAKVRNIEMFDITGTGNNILTLNKTISGSSLVIVTGDAGDTVVSYDQQWVSNGREVFDGVNYDRYYAYPVKLLVHPSIQLFITRAPTLSSVDFTIDEGLIGGTRIGQLDGMDADFGDAITYRILSGNDAGIFSLDQNGWLSVSADASIDYEDANNGGYQLQVQVEDDLGKSDEAIINININDLITNSSNTTVSFSVSNESVWGDSMVATIDDLFAAAGNGTTKSATLYKTCDDDSLMPAAIPADVFDIIVTCDLELEYQITFSGGRVDIDLPITMDLDYADEISSGSQVSINVSSALESGAGFVATTPVFAAGGRLNSDNFEVTVNADGAELLHKAQGSDRVTVEYIEGTVESTHYSTVDTNNAFLMSASIDKPDWFNTNINWDEYILQLLQMMNIPANIGHKEAHLGVATYTLDYTYMHKEVNGDVGFSQQLDFEVLGYDAQLTLENGDVIDLVIPLNGQFDFNMPVDADSNGDGAVDASLNITPQHNFSNNAAIDYSLTYEFTAFGANINVDPYALPGSVDYPVGPVILADPTLSGTESYHPDDFGFEMDSQTITLVFDLADTDSDGDGVADTADAFPNDDSETTDSDGDGVGDNADAFPDDANETLDNDGDGVGDNSDEFPNDSAEARDTDGDGIGDNADTDDAGDLDLSFNQTGWLSETTMDGELYSVARNFAQAQDGNLLAVGYNTAGGNNLFFAKYNLDGSRDTNFASAGIFAGKPTGSGILATAMAETDSGEIFLGAYEQESSSLSVIKLHENGTIDTNFASGGIWSSSDSSPSRAKYTHAMHVQDDGKILVGSMSANSENNSISRLNSDGSIDSGFATDGKIIFDFVDGATVESLVDMQLLDDGKILLLIDVEENNDSQLIRLNSDGSLDSEFADAGVMVLDSATYGSVEAFSVNKNSQILLAGFSADQLIVSRWLFDGSVDISYADSGISTQQLSDDMASIKGVIALADGRVIIGGNTTNNNLFAARLLENGELDLDFSGDGYRAVDIGIGTDVYDVQLQSNNKILFSGSVRDGRGMMFTARMLNDIDTDGDGVTDYIDRDDDNDGVSDELDVMPTDPDETSDNDNDGIGDNRDTDDDNDGTLDIYDDLPFDENETTDSDGDGVGDNSDPMPLPAGELNIEFASYEVDENGYALTINVVRTGGSYGAMSVDYLLQDATATASVDYQFDTNTLTFLDGETEQTITVTQIDDSEYEGNETLTLVLNNFIGEGSLGANNQATITLIEDDSVPPSGALSFEFSAYLVYEEEASVDLTVTRLGGSYGEVSVNYSTVDNAAMASIDYVAVSGLLTFADGVTSQIVSISLLNDHDYEGDESFFVMLSNVQGGSLLVDPFIATVNIFDDTDTPAAGTLSFENATYEINESSSLLLVTIVRNGGEFGAVSATVITSSGTAQAGEDYQSVSTTINFADGEVSQTVSLSLIDDLVYEGDESLTLRMIDVTGTVAGSQGTASITIIEDDVAPVAGVIGFSGAAYQVAENDGSVIVTLTRTNGSDGEVGVELSSSDASATADEDYQAVNQTVIFADGEISKLVEVTIHDDLDYEGDEQFTLSLQNITGGASLSSINTATVSIIEDEAVPVSGTVQFSGTTYRVNEADGAITLTLLRVGGDYGELSVDYTLVSDTATESDDYSSVDGTVMFADGGMVKVITIGIVDDAIAEAAESFTVQLFDADVEIDVATISVEDNDALPEDDVIDTGTETNTETGGGGSVSLYLLLWLLLFSLQRKERRQIGMALN